MIHLTFNRFPISINKLYVNLVGQRRRFLSTEGKRFKSDTIQDVKNQTSSTIVSKLENKKLEVTIKLFTPSWVLKDGVTIRKKDASSFEKVQIDAIFDAFKEICPDLELDDSQIWNISLQKHLSSDEYTEVIITPL